MAATAKVTVDAVGDPEPITTISPWCRRVRLREKSIPPTLDFSVRAPLTSSEEFTLSKGELCEIRLRYRVPANTIVGYINTLSGSADFVQLEDD